MSLRKFTITAAVSIAGALAASPAHAGPDVHWQLRVETPVIWRPLLGRGAWFKRGISFGGFGAPGGGLA